MEGIAWKKKKKEKKLETSIFFIRSISQNSMHYTYATSLFQVGKCVKIVLQVSVFLTFRGRARFRSGFVSVIYIGYPLNIL